MKLKFRLVLDQDVAIKYNSFWLAIKYFLLYYTSLKTNDRTFLFILSELW